MSLNEPTPSPTTIVNRAIRRVAREQYDEARAGGQIPEDTNKLAWILDEEARLHAEWGNESYHALRVITIGLAHSGDLVYLLAAHLKDLVAACRDCNLKAGQPGGRRASSPVDPLSPLKHCGHHACNQV